MTTVLMALAALAGLVLVAGFVAVAAGFVSLAVGG